MAHHYRLMPTPEQEEILREHCAHARFVFNLCVEQQSWFRPDRKGFPGQAERSRQLTEARAAFAWLAAGSATIQQQALRDFSDCMEKYFRGIHHKPGYRKAIRNEGFRVVGRRGEGDGCAWHVRRLSRNVGEVRVPKSGWIRFRWSRPVPDDARSYRVKLDRSGRWHISFISPHGTIPAPGTGEVVGIDRGVTVSATLSTGEMLHSPKLTPGRSKRLHLLQRQFRRTKADSRRHAKVKRAIAKLHVSNTDARKDWCEKVSTDLARRFDIIRVEDLNIRAMVRTARGTRENPGTNVAVKGQLNYSILRSGWGRLVRRLDDKAPGRVERVKPYLTSQRCSACGHVDRQSRESQARFRCTACGFACNADVNAAMNIAAGHAVTARGGDGVARPANREPQAA